MNSLISPHSYEVTVKSFFIFHLRNLGQFCCFSKAQESRAPLDYFPLHAAHFFWRGRWEEKLGGRTMWGKEGLEESFMVGVPCWDHAGFKERGRNTHTLLPVTQIGRQWGTYKHRRFSVLPATSATFIWDLPNASSAVSTHLKASPLPLLRSISQPPKAFHLSLSHSCTLRPSPGPRLGHDCETALGLGQKKYWDSTGQYGFAGEAPTTSSLWYLWGLPHLFSSLWSFPGAPQTFSSWPPYLLNYLSKWENNMLLLTSAVIFLFSLFFALSWATDFQEAAQYNLITLFSQLLK